MKIECCSDWWKTHNCFDRNTWLDTHIHNGHGTPRSAQFTFFISLFFLSRWYVVIVCTFYFLFRPFPFSFSLFIYCHVIHIAHCLAQKSISKNKHCTFPFFRSYSMNNKTNIVERKSCMLKHWNDTLSYTCYRAESRDSKHIWEIERWIALWKSTTSSVWIRFRQRDAYNDAYATVHGNENPLLNRRMSVLLHLGFSLSDFFIFSCLRACVDAFYLVSAPNTCSVHLAHPFHILVMCALLFSSLSFL